MSLSKITADWLLERTGSLFKRCEEDEEKKDGERGKGLGEEVSTSSLYSNKAAREEEEEKVVVVVLVGSAVRPPLWWWRGEEEEEDERGADDDERQVENNISCDD